MNRNEGAPEYAGIFILDNPYCIDASYDYYIPQDLRAAVSPGVFVTVPFGHGNRKQIGVVAKVHSCATAKRIKSIAGLCSERISLSAEMLSLCLWLHEQTLCTVGEAVRCVLPSASMSHIVDYFSPAPGVEPPDLDKKLDAAHLLVFNYIIARGSVSMHALRARFGAGVGEIVSELTDKGFVLKQAEEKHGSDGVFATLYTLNIPRDQAQRIADGDKTAAVRLTSQKQKALLARAILLDRSADKDELCQGTDAGSAQLKALVEKGLLSTEKKQIYRNPYAIPADFTPAPDPVLNEQQAAAVNTLISLADSGEARAALLFGVTGSGKTYVMAKLLDKLLADGKGAILMLPEISLTPQSVALFCARYGDTVAVIHSGLSAGERQDAYARISSGQARLVIGTRSAVFAPVPNLGLIIMDEEQEHTYKSDQDPKYHARDVARWRCAYNKALLLLASATPSLESYAKAQAGTYTLLSLTERYNKTNLPEVTVADMREGAAKGLTSPLGTLLTDALSETVESGRQAVLFLNRRGYHRFISCASCGTAVTCPHCSVAMTYHVKNGTYTEGELICHWCGTRMQVPQKCPSCDSQHLRHTGFGTQRVQQELEMLLPDARVMRLDADTTSAKFSMDKLLGEFRDGKADVMIGTQMVTKGHNFPDVTLVGVLLADASLYVDDYRAAERTFAMLTQVIGRAGRGDVQGHAIIQTNNPDSDVITLACAQDYHTFYEREIKLRRLLTFPPYCDIVLLTLTAADEKELMIHAVRLREELDRLGSGDFCDVPMLIFGPFEAPVYRVEEKYRMRLVIKCRLNKRSRELFSKILVRFGKDGAKKSVLGIDFNPSSL
ncbi:MAG: primosomal protein N' [Clostridia bacterium]|nr:primosomal protein N' [Clostridia bacterium]MBQ7380352.1 primosomal protein N' [Clostridia bacterium]